MGIKLSDGREIPMEMHKVKIVQKTNLIPARQRLEAMTESGYNTFLLRTRDIFLDMLTDSGTNAMSDNQLAAMMVSDDAYAGSESYYKLCAAVKEVFGLEYVLPAHQGRAAEHLIAKVLVKPGDVIPMNYHFTTTRAHFEILGGTVHELFHDSALETSSALPFKGNLDVKKLQAIIEQVGADKVSFVRMEATTNLIGGQPFSLANLKEVQKLANQHNIPVVLDASLISENAYLIKQREKEYASASIRDIIQEMMACADLMYLSGRKSCAVRGGMLATNHKKYFDQLLPWLPVYEGFMTYGGMSTKEIEAMAVGIREMVDDNVAGSSVEFIKHFVNELDKRGVPVVTPPGGLACHVDAKKFVPHIPQQQYPAGALSAAIYLSSGVRSMERGTISTDRDKDGKEIMADMELARLAVPRRIFTLSQIEYTIDRVAWLYKHRNLIKGLAFVEEPPVLRFFFGKLKPMDNWGEKLVKAFEAEFGAEC
ncbi:MAG TPA: tryptophanase [bacterium]|nr:tryptophanase [bacterium]